MSRTAARLDPAIPDARVADRDDQREPTGADQHHRLEGVGQRMPDHVEDVRAKRETEHQVLGVRGQTEAADRATADQVAAQVSEQQQAEQ